MRQTRSMTSRSDKCVGRRDIDWCEVGGRVRLNRRQLDAAVREPHRSREGMLTPELATPWEASVPARAGQSRSR
jgi:hypothetical protein